MDPITTAAMPGASETPAPPVAAAAAAAAVKPEPTFTMSWAGLGLPTASPQPPAEIITIADRRLRLKGNGMEEPSLYSLCRQWTYNNPNATYSGPLEDSYRLPSIQSRAGKGGGGEGAGVDASGAPTASLAPADMDGPQRLEEATLTAHKQRWRAAGEAMRQAAVAARAPFVQRLQTIVRTPGN